MSAPSVEVAAPLGTAQRRQIVWITVGAIAVFATLRLLPTGTNLSHMDFRVDAKNSIEFCDPLNPQFIPVVAVKSPVSLSLTTASTPASNHPVNCVVALRTASGKAIVPEDLVVAHTRKLHLLIVDSTLTDYQHVHPEPAKTRGEWTFAFTPKRSGTYRVFADFTPAATGRGLYASADLEVGQVSDLPRSDQSNAVSAGQVKDLTYPERNGYRFTLTPGSPSLRAGQPIDLTFAVTRPDGGAVPLEPVMGAFAHLVAFDETRSGFAHLHPMEIDLAQRPDPQHPVLHFKVTIPRAGRYVVWAQVNLAGHEEFVPFWFEVG
jgi:hypothetical protein